MDTSIVNPANLKVNSVFTDLGLRIIPLRPNGKKPLRRGWLTLPDADQWLGAPPNSNAGLMPNGERVVVDQDGLSTRGAVRRLLEGLGYPAIEEQTATPDHAATWIRCKGIPEWFSMGALLCGEGEFRARNVYQVIPDSIIDGRPYQWINGGPLNFPTLPLLDLRDLAAIVKISDAAPLALDQPPLPLLRREPSGYFLSLLAKSRGLKEGEPIEGYASRSDAEFAAVCSFVVSGLSFEEVYRCFENKLPGHYVHKGLWRREWLKGEYKRALARLQACTPARGEIIKLYRLANAQPWPGRMGFYDLSALNAVYSIAWQAGALSPRVTVRDVALLAGFAAWGRNASHALHRLEGAGWLRREQGKFLLLPPPKTLNPPPVSYASSTQQPTPEDADLWGKMGRTTGAVYALLGTDPLEIKALVERTGKNRVTVWRALWRLAALDLAERSGAGWIKGSGNLEDAEEVLGCAQSVRTRRRIVERQRERYHEGRRKREGKTKAA